MAAANYAISGLEDAVETQFSACLEELRLFIDFCKSAFRLSHLGCKDQLAILTVSSAHFMFANFITVALS